MNFKSSLTMLLLMTTLCLIFHAWTCSANPGLSVQISQKGLDYASQIATNKLHETMQNSKIPDMSKDGKVKYSLYNIRVNSFAGLSNHVQLIPSNQLKWTVTIGHISISLNWRYAKKLGWFWIRDSGSAHLTFSNTQLSINAAIIKKESGLGIHTTSCSSHTDLKVSTSNWMLKIILFFTKSKLRSSIERKLCSKAKEAIDNKLGPVVSNYPVIIPFGGDYIFDYGFVSNPVITSTYMKTNHKAAVYYKNGPRTIPFTPKALPSISGNNKMITFIISDYVFDTWLYAAYQKGLMKYTLSANSLPDIIRPMLQTSCPNSVCIGTAIPQLGIDFPKQRLGFEVVCSGHPETTFLPGRVQINIPTQVQVTVDGPKNVSVLNISLSVLTDMSVKTKDDLILFSINKFSLKLGAMRSKYITKTDVEALEKSIHPIFALLTQYFNDFGPNGFPLVLPDKTDVSNLSLSILKNAMVLAADLNLPAL